jgi:hypothetical protein
MFASLCIPVPFYKRALPLGIPLKGSLGSQATHDTWDLELMERKICIKTVPAFWDVPDEEGPLEAQHV